jgi:WD40 repeat protein
MEINCTCGKRLRIKDELAGKRVKCPGCGQSLMVRETEEIDEPRPLRRLRKEEEADSVRPQRKKKKTKASAGFLLLWVLLGAGGFLAVTSVAVALLLFFNRNKADGPAGSESQHAGNSPLDDKNAGRNPLQSEPFVQLVAFSPNGKKLATATRAIKAKGTNHTVKFWDLATGKEEKRFEGHQDFISRLAFSPDGTLLASASTQGNELKLWNIETGKLLHEDKFANEKENWLVPVGFSADGKLLVTYGKHGLVAMNVKDGSLRRFVAQSLFATIVCSPVANTVLLTDLDIKVDPPEPLLILFDLDKWTITNFIKLDDLLSSMAFSRDGKTLALGCNGGPIVLMDGTTLTRRATLDRKRTLTGFQYFDRIALSPDGKFVVAKPMAQGKPSCEVWDTSKPSTEAIPEGYCSAMALSPDGQTIALVKDEVVRFYDPVTLKEKNP